MTPGALVMGVEEMILYLFIGDQNHPHTDDPAAHYQRRPNQLRNDACINLRQTQQQIT